MKHTTSKRKERKQIFQIAEIAIEVTWKPVRNLNLRLTSEGVIRASVPSRTTISAVEQFLAKNLPWMRRTIARSKRCGMPDMPQVAQGAKVIFFGFAYTLDVVEGKNVGLSLSQGVARLTVRPGISEASRNSCLKEASRQLLQEAIAAHFPYLEAQTGLCASSWYIRDMKSLWGSCNIRTKRICLNLRLVQKPLVCLDAVIAHELVHTKVRNHGRDFYATLDAVWPAWRDAEVILRAKC